MNLILIATAPVLIILFYIYYRDKYEKEPFGLLIKSLIGGMLICIPIIFGEQWTASMLLPYKNNQFIDAFMDAFFVASFWEESFKLTAVMLLVWRNKNFNERFDGIVYAVFVSLGFALIENIMYVVNTDNGLHTGIARAFTAVPAHAMFGVMMGYHLGLARFIGKHQSFHLFNAFFYPFLFHGLYDFILMSQSKWLLLTFAPLMVYLYIRIKKRLLQHSNDSVFKPLNLSDD
ncbi:PrsW family glutamic-type intramembrane protease [Carboxylicivirga linearis]|uniref:Protease PrsW n=1 Tax=Carboxylicivirga linearis TaxID=1628157 RepID=A0ABS5JX01_9BACT|nr:PrsW family glutamic-type intramembrane protease [Carboxylicivirga linearis]MBS2099452.1 PrsW family intramembrane metalloprotease [Carboxylicivirga linearis]